MDPKQEQYEYESCTNSAGTRVLLDHHNCDLNFVIEPDGLTGSTLHKNGFEYLWAGARATHGVRTGKVCHVYNVYKRPDGPSGWHVNVWCLDLNQASLAFSYINSSIAIFDISNSDLID